MARGRHGLMAINMWEYMYIDWWAAKLARFQLRSDGGRAERILEVRRCEPLLRDLGAYWGLTGAA